jgi:glycerol kinase
MQLQADLLGVEVVRPAFVELTALGAAELAARAVGFFHDPTGTAAADVGVSRFSPTLPEDQRQAQLARWQEAVAKA